MEKEILVTRSSMPPFEEYVNEIRELWDSRWLTNFGVKHRALEQALAEYLEVDYVMPGVNGHQSLECLIESMDLKGEVITTPFTFASTTHALIRKGLKPVFCDVREDDFTLDPEKIEDLITDQTSAILGVHVYGNACDTEAIQSIADRHGLKVLYDAAHAFGVKKNGIGIANYGDASMFSFHATKVFHCIEGGALAFRDPALKEKLKMWEDFGLDSTGAVPVVGGNAKMNEFSAAMGLCNLRHVGDAIKARGEAVKAYWEFLDGVKGIRLNQPQEGVQTNYAYFPVLFDPKEFGCDRDEVQEYLAEGNIRARKYFYPLTNEMDGVRKKYLPEETPIAKRLSLQVLALPLYEELTREDVKRICTRILQCKK